MVTGGSAPQGALHYFLLPYMEQDNLYRNSNNNPASVVTTVIKPFLCPSDATAPGGLTPMRYGHAGTSYAGNLMVFGNSTTGPSGGRRIENIPDGTSNTVAFAERYLNCYQGTAPCSGGCTYPTWGWYNGHPAGLWDVPLFNDGTTWQGATTQGIFQTTPSINNCDWRVLQSAHSGTMQVGMADGSVRGVAPAIGLSNWQIVTQPSDGLTPDGNW
jgi:prepilin-type processing-associated H-X9-DG protein